jgi:hypothetical protein
MTPWIEISACKLVIYHRITLGTGVFKPAALTYTQFNLKINIKSPNYFYELKFVGNTEAPSNA